MGGPAGLSRATAPLAGRAGDRSGIRDPPESIPGRLRTSYGKSVALRRYISARKAWSLAKVRDYWVFGDEPRWLRGAWFWIGRHGTSARVVCTAWAWSTIRS